MIILEQQINEYEVIHNIMDKIDLYIESDLTATESFDDLIAEMYDVYLEATDRRKQQQEIAKYMRDNQMGDVEGSNPSKRKKARKVQNTLLQHDFDPKTQTIRSDVTNADGSQMRVKLQTPNSDHKTGAHYQPSKVSGDDYVSLPKDKLNRNKQYKTAMTMHHELGHHQSYHRNSDTTVGRNALRTDPNDPGMKFIADTKAMGKKINDHDDGSYLNGHDNPEELYADLHGARAARVRTKHWGNQSSGKNYKEKLNNGTRGVTDEEIKTDFIGLAHYWRDVYYMRHKIQLKKLINVQNMFSSIRTDDDVENMGSKDKRKFLKQIPDAEKTITEYLELLEAAQDSKYEKNQYSEKLKELRVKLDNLIRRGRTSDFESVIPNLRNDIIEFEKLFEEARRRAQETNNKFIAYAKKLKQYFPNYKQDLNNTDIYAGDLSDDYIKGFIVDIDNIMEQLNATIETEKKIIMQGSKLVDDSTKMRYDFVMKYKDDKTVQEYFTELFNEYYNLKNLENGDLYE